MGKRKTVNEVNGVFNILLIGKNPHAISIADNIKSKLDVGVDNLNLNWNIVDDFECEIRAKSWFNEFIFWLTSLGQYNNIIYSERFYDWLRSCNNVMQKMYMKKLLQAMNVIIVDITDTPPNVEFDYDYEGDIPYHHFNSDKDFLTDLLDWISEKFKSIVPMLNKISLIRSLSGNAIPYLGNVFGCLCGKCCNNIVKANDLRYDVPILFDEFCFISRDKTLEEIDDSIYTRTNSAMSVFFK